MRYERDLRSEAAKYITRRWFFQQCGVGLSAIALGSMLGAERALGASAKSAVTNPLAPRQPHVAGKAKRVIYLFMGGAPSQLDLFDYKPSLQKYSGQPVPKEVVMGQKYAFIKPDAALFASEFKFAKHGKSGAELCEEFSSSIRKVNSHESRPGDVDRVSPSIGDIHVVSNAGTQTALSIHVYGANIGAVRRHTYDAATGLPRDFVSGYQNASIPNLWDRSKA